MDLSASAEAYDKLPYEGHADAMMHPNRAAAVAWLMGMDAAKPEGARVLDIGCATGGHVIPMAYQFPEAEFVGFDYSARQVEMAREMAGRVGVKNLRLEVRDIRDGAGGLGTFDYVIVHGVYSWVPAEVRGKLMELCRECLRDRGVAIVDYNVLPGWRMKGILRDVMRVAGEGRMSNDECRMSNQSSNPNAQNILARELIELVGRNVFVPGSPYGQAVGQLAQWAAGQQADYLAHEFGAPVNDAVLYGDFVAGARAAGLEPVGDVQIATVMPPGRGDVQAKVEALARGDAVRREEILDLLRGREFRRTLLVKAGAGGAGAPQLEAMARIWLTTTARAQREGGAVAYRCADGTTVRPSDGPTQRLMEAMGAASPGAVGFEALRLAMGVAAQAAAGRMLELAAAGVLQVYGSAVKVATRLSERPRANSVARVQGEMGRGVVTNMWHQPWAADALTRRVLALLDGSRDQQALVQRLWEQEPTANRQELEQAVVRTLQWCCLTGMLEA